MALWFIEGFEAYGDTNGVAPNSTAINGPWDSSSFSGSVTRTLEDGRISGKSLRIAGGSQTDTALPSNHNNTINGATGDDEAILGFAFKATTLFNGAFAGLQQNNRLLHFGISLHLVDTGALAVGIGDGSSSFSIDGTSVSTPIQADTWHYIEFKVLTSDTGSYEVKVDGVTVLSGTADTLIIGTNNRAICFFGAGSGNEYFIDDLYVLDTTGSVNNDFLGDQYVLTLHPIGNGTTNTGTPTPTVDAWENISETLQDGDTSYVTVGSGTLDLFVFDGVDEFSAIAGVRCTTIGRRVSGGTPQNLVNRARSGGNNYTVGSSANLGTSYFSVTGVAGVDPDTSLLWDQTSLNAAEFGFSRLNAGSCQVTQHYIAVLGTYIQPPQQYDVAATTVITVTSESRNTWMTVSAENSIAATGEATGKIPYVDVACESEIVVDHEATPNFSRSAVAETTISITDTASANRSRAVDAISEIIVYDTIIDPETLEEIPFERGIESEAEVTKSLPVSGSSTIAAAQVARELGDYTSTQIEVTQSASVVLSNAQAESTIEVASIASANVTRGVSASTAIAIVHSAGYTLPANNTECIFSPFIGGTDDPDAPTPPPASLPAASSTTGFRLQYPAEGEVTDEVILRSPSFGDIHRLSFDRINLETRGGSLVVFADPIWPKIETLLLSFSGLSRDKAYELKAFMLGHLGQEIRLIDHENRAWIGIIANPQDPIVQDGRGSFTASFDFEGERDV